MNLSGRVIGLIFKPLSNSPSSDRKVATCEKNPPIDPSSTVNSTQCSLASCRTSPVSRGLQNRMSATVVVTPASCSMVAASRHCTSVEPYPRRATSLPPRRTTPLPICKHCSKLDKALHLQHGWHSSRIHHLSSRIHHLASQRKDKTDSYRLGHAHQGCMIDCNIQNEPE